MELDQGKGTAGKLLKDDTLYKNLNSAVAQTNELVASINAGKGALGKLSKDPEFANKLDETVTSLDTLLKGINEGKGTLGQFAQNRSLYDHADQTVDQAQQLVKAIRENPKKYLVIQLKVFYSSPRTIDRPAFGPVLWHREVLCVFLFWLRSRRSCLPVESRSGWLRAPPGR